MSEMTCLHCGATTSNGLALCELCQRKATVILDVLPIYFRNLARWRPGRAGARPVPGSRVLYDGEIRGTGTGDRISDRLDEAATTLTTWARALVDDRPGFSRPLTRDDAVLTGDLPDDLGDDMSQIVTWLCAAFEHRLVSIGALEWCGEFVRDLDHHEAILRGLTEVSIPGWYAGACRRRVSMESTCGAPTYVVPGLTWVTCGRCGATTYARDHLAVISDEASEWVARPKAIAEAIVALVDTEQSVPKLHTRIRQWAHQGDVKSIRRTQRGYVWSAEEERLVVGQEEVGHARYRFGDVLSLVLRRNTPSVEKVRAS